MSLMTNARAFIVAAILLSLFLVSGNQLGTVFAQPLSDSMTVFTSGESGYWSSIAEKNDWALYAPKTVTTADFSTIYQFMAEENSQALDAPKTITTGRFSNLYQMMAEENASQNIS